MAEREFGKSDQQEKVIGIERVTKVVKGGKNMRFRATVVVGDLKGKVGVGVSKALEVPKAIRKAIEDAKKNQVEISFDGTTIAHDVIGKFKAAKVLMRPARKGTGVIAAGAIRSVLELAGIKDVVAKSLGSKSAINTAKATIDGLSSLMDRSEVENLRGVKLSLRNIEQVMEDQVSEAKEQSEASKEASAAEKAE